MTLQLSLLLRRPEAAPDPPPAASHCPTGLKTPCLGETNCSCRSSSGSSVSGTVGAATCLDEDGKQEATVVSGS